MNLNLTTLFLAMYLDVFLFTPSLFFYSRNFSSQKNVKLDLEFLKNHFVHFYPVLNVHVRNMCSLVKTLIELNLRLK